MGFYLTRGISRGCRLHVSVNTIHLNVCDQCYFTYIYMLVIWHVPEAGFAPLNTNEKLTEFKLNSFRGRWRLVVYNEPNTVYSTTF
jgi:hypothetical protein